MQCRKIQELLKSDYLDSQTNQEEQLYVKEHLAQCPDCRRLEKELLTQRRLFQKAKPQHPPERVWQNIRDTIVTERFNQDSSLSRGFLERLSGLIRARRPVFALASVLAAIIFVVVLAGTIIHKEESLSKVNGGESLAEYRLNGANEDLLYSLGTNVEEYFL